jgi:glutaredoxin
MQPKSRAPLWVALFVLATTAGAAHAWKPQLDSFARCVRDSGATFYGTYWCPQCKAQRELFGRADRYIRYVECAEQGTDEQTRACKKAGIKSYPTWEFGDGSRVTGRQPLERLAQHTRCELPAD